MGLAKIGIAVLAVCLAGVVWPSLIYILNNSEIDFLRAVAFFFSDQTLLGYGLFGLLSIWFYHLFERWFFALASKNKPSS